METKIAMNPNGKNVLMPWISTKNGLYQSRLLGRFLGEIRPDNLCGLLSAETGMSQKRVTCRFEPAGRDMMCVDIEGIDSEESAYVRAWLRHMLPGSWRYSVNSPEVDTEVAEDIQAMLFEKFR